MRYLSNSWAVLPAAQVLFGKGKVSLAEIAEFWGDGTVVVCEKPNGQLHFIAGSSGNYAEIGSRHAAHHDQTGASFGYWIVKNEITYKKNADGVIEFTYKVPPVEGETTAKRASMGVFK